MLGSFLQFLKNWKILFIHLTLFDYFIILDLGGSLKKYNSFDQHMVLLGIIIPFLLFFISLNTAYAFFTATAAKSESTSNTATIRINIGEVGETVTDVNQVVTSSTTEGVVNKVLPGDELTLAGTLANAGSAECYVILEFKIDVTKVGSTESENITKEYYTFTTTSSSPLAYSQTKITESEGTYSSNAGIICANNESETNTDDERNFSLSYTFDGATFGDVYKNANITYTIRAYAIQTVGITNGASGATALLMEYLSNN